MIYCRAKRRSILQTFAQQSQVPELLAKMDRERWPSGGGYKLKGLQWVKDDGHRTRSPKPAPKRRKGGGGADEGGGGGEVKVDLMDTLGGSGGRDGGGGDGEMKT